MQPKSTILSLFKNHQVDYVDIAMDACAPHHYKEAEDLANFKSTKTSRGPLQEGWREDTQPIMCRCLNQSEVPSTYRTNLFSSYKLVDVRFDMTYLMQARIEEFVHKVKLVMLILLSRQLKITEYS